MAEQQRQTWLSVSPFIHQHLKRGTKQFGSVCWDCPFIPLTAGVYKKYKSHLCVSVNSREAWFGWMKRGSKFLHFTEAYIIFLLPVKQNVFSTGSLVLVMVKKTKKQKTRVRNKKVVVPNATMQTLPHRRHLVEVQVLGKVDHRNNGRMESRRIRSEGSDFSEKWD